MSQSMTHHVYNMCNVLIIHMHTLELCNVMYITKQGYSLVTPQYVKHVTRYGVNVQLYVLASSAVRHVSYVVYDPQYV